MSWWFVLIKTRAALVAPLGMKNIVLALLSHKLPSCVVLNRLKIALPVLSVGANSNCNNKERSRLPSKRLSEIQRDGTAATVNKEAQAFWPLTRLGRWVAPLGAAIDPLLKRVPS